MLVLSDILISQTRYEKTFDNEVRNSSSINRLRSVETSANMNVLIESENVHFQLNIQVTESLNT